MIPLSCPSCGREFECSDFLAGLTVVCKSCGHRVPVPGGKPPAAARQEAVTAAPPPSPNPAPKPIVREPSSKGPPVREPFSDGTPLNERAEAMLEAGMSLPLIKERLVALGLTPDVADALLIKVLDERAAREKRQALQRDKKGASLVEKLAAIWWGQLILSLCFFAAALVAYEQITEIETVGRGRIFALLGFFYLVLGKWGCVWGLVIIGIVFAVLGIRNLIKSGDRSR